MILQLLAASARSPSLTFNAEWPDLVKALILLLFAFGVLMILGDIYRGEIQNTPHRLLVVARPEHVKQVGIPQFARRKGARDGKIMEVPIGLIQPTLDGVHSNVLVDFAYLDYAGRRRLRRIDVFEVKFQVRKQAFRIGTNSRFPEDHKQRFTADGALDEDDLAPPHIVSLAASRVDLIEEERKSLFEHLTEETERLHRWRNGITISQIRDPTPEGIIVKFHFPIDPYFLLYKHPDRDVKMTAWLTILTSVFSLMSELIFRQ